MSRDAHDRPFDLVLRGGTVADGTGGALREADVAVRGGRIAQVGRIEGLGHREIDAAGLLVAPGWVDIHTHYDGQATWDNRLAPSSQHGVTTTVFGNCGVGFAPVRPAEHERLIALMEGVEDIPGTALHEGLPWTWESFPQYLDALETLPHDIDLAAQVPHGALRVHVMGDRGAAGEEATAADIAEMAHLVAEAVRAGAVGFSTSRSTNHRSSTGEPTPSLNAGAAELLGIARAMGATGRGVLQLLSDFADLDAEWALVRAMAQVSGRPLSFSLAQNVTFSAHGIRVPYLDLLERMRAADAAGITIRAQVAPRAIGLMMGLQASLHPFLFNPVFAEVAGAPHAEQVAALRTTTFRERLLAAGQGAPDPAKMGANLVGAFHLLVELGDPPLYDPPAGSDLRTRAAAAGTTPAALALDLMLAHDGTGLLYLPAFNYLDWDFAAVREMLTHDYAVPGLSDGGAHVGTICDGGFPTFLLAHWGRDAGADRLPVEWIVQRQAAATAALVGLADRGVLAPGYRADLNVIDLPGLRVDPPAMHADLPAGGLRFLQAAHGYRHTFVAGVETYADGEPTGALPGRLVRGPQATGR